MMKKLLGFFRNKKQVVAAGDVQSEIKIEYNKPTIEAIEFALKSLNSIIDFKFNYWYLRKIYPIYIAKGIDHVTSKLVADTKNKFVADVVTSLIPI